MKKLNMQISGPAANDAHMGSTTVSAGHSLRRWLQSRYDEAIRRQLLSVPLAADEVAVGWTLVGTELSVGVDAFQDDDRQDSSRGLNSSNLRSRFHMLATPGLRWIPAGSLPDIRTFANHPENATALRLLGLRLKAHVGFAADVAAGEPGPDSVETATPGLRKAA